MKIPQRSVAVNMAGIANRELVLRISSLLSFFQLQAMSILSPLTLELNHS